MCAHGRTDVTKLTADFRNVANAPKMVACTVTQWTMYYETLCNKPQITRSTNMWLLDLQYVNVREPPVSNNEACYNSFLYVRVEKMFSTDLQRVLSPSVYGSLCILVYLPCQSEKIWRRRCERRRSLTAWHAVGYPFIATSLAAKAASSLPRRPTRSGTRYPDLHNPFICNYVRQICMKKSRRFVCLISTQRGSIVHDFV